LSKPGLPSTSTYGVAYNDDDHPGNLSNIH